MRARLVCALLWLVQAPSAALACSCLPRSEAQIVAAADVAVVATVVEARRMRDAGPERVRATLEVRRTLKGRVHRRITVSTPLDGARCGVTFRPGATLRFAAGRFADGLWTNLCQMLGRPG